MRRAFNSLGILVLTVLVAACVTAPKVSELPDPSPPQLVSEGKRDANGKELLRWDRPQAFGKLVGSQKITGDIACMAADIGYEAIGFHPRAKDSSGREMPSGGYFCSPKANGDRPDSNAPRLVRIDGILGWDRPSAFGKVPEQLKIRGDQVCQKASGNSQAVGYHPSARLENGNTIVGGGFFCLPRVNR